MAFTRILIAAAAVIGVANCFVGIPASMPALRSSREPQISVSMRAGVERRDALKVLIGGGAAAFAGFSVAPKLDDLSAEVPHHLWERWELVPAAEAYVETKAELLEQAKQIEKAFVAMVGFIDDVEKSVNQTETQRSWYEIQRSLSSGALSSLRGCCFHLYRNHVTNPKQFKEAEAQYKVVTRSLEKFSVKALQASRNELNADQLKEIKPALEVALQEFKAYISIVTPS